MSDTIDFGIGTSKARLRVRDADSDNVTEFYQDPFRLDEVANFERLTLSDATNKKVQKESTDFFIKVLNRRRLDRSQTVTIKFFNNLSVQELVGIGVLLSAGALKLSEELQEDGTTEKK